MSNEIQQKTKSVIDTLTAELDLITIENPPSGVRTNRLLAFALLGDIDSLNQIDWPDNVIFKDSDQNERKLDDVMRDLFFLAHIAIGERTWKELLELAAQKEDYRSSVSKLNDILSTGKYPLNAHSRFNLLDYEKYPWITEEGRTFHLSLVDQRVIMMDTLERHEGNIIDKITRDLIAVRVSPEELEDTLKSLIKTAQEGNISQLSQSLHTLEKAHFQNREGETVEYNSLMRDLFFLAHIAIGERTWKELLELAQQRRDYSTLLDNLNNILNTGEYPLIENPNYSLLNYEKYPWITENGQRFYLIIAGQKALISRVLGNPEQ